MEFSQIIKGDNGNLEQISGQTSYGGARLPLSGTTKRRTLQRINASSFQTSLDTEGLTHAAMEMFSKISKKEIITNVPVAPYEYFSNERREIEQFSTLDPIATKLWRSFVVDSQSVRKTGDIRRTTIVRYLLDPGENAMLITSIPNFLQAVERRKQMLQERIVGDSRFVPTGYQIIYIERSLKDPFRVPLLTATLLPDQQLHLRVWQNYGSTERTVHTEKLHRSGESPYDKGTFYPEEVRLPDGAQLWIAAINPQEAQQRGLVISR